VIGMSFDDLVDEILYYESDTFSAIADKLSRKEAKKVAMILILRWKNSCLDGIAIVHTLNYVRSNKLVK